MACTLPQAMASKIALQMGFNTRILNFSLILKMSHSPKKWREMVPAKPFHVCNTTDYVKIM